jgi:hypothetical protein
MTRSDGRTALGLASACTVVVWLIPRVVLAQADEAGARVLFVEARKLVKSGNYAEACSKFEDSYRLDPGIGTSFNLADCLQHLGRITSAWARFLDVAAATKAAGQLDRERIARARAAALEPRLARMTIQVESPAVGLSIARDGVVIGAPSWGIAVPVDPGPHKVEVSAPRKKKWSTVVLVDDAPTTVSVTVPELTDDPEPEPIAVAALGKAGDRSSRSMDTIPIDGKLTRRWSKPVIALGAVATAAFATATGFGIAFELDNGKAKSICPSSVGCTSQDMSNHARLVDEASRNLKVEYACLGVGGGALLAAAYLRWRDVRHAGTAGVTQLTISPVEPGLRGLALNVPW